MEEGDEEEEEEEEEEDGETRENSAVMRWSKEIKKVTAA